MACIKRTTSWVSDSRETCFDLQFKAHISEQYTPIGVLNIKNKCCSGRPVIQTRGSRHGVYYYSMQCACGTWVTGGFPTPEDALNDWNRMNNDVPDFNVPFNNYAEDPE